MSNLSTGKQIQAEQIPFDLGARPALRRGDFLIGPSNAAAVGWIDRWPEWGAPMLVLHGPAASGKTHLGTVWQEKNGAATIRPELLAEREALDLFESGPALLLDGLDPWLGDREAETTLFHLYNMLKEERKTMMITLRMAPAHADFAIADLASRFRAAPVVTIQPPDDMLLGSVLIKLFSDRQLNVSHDVIAYLLPRIERSFSAARDVVALADRVALAEKRPVSIPLMRKVLSGMQAG